MITIIFCFEFHHSKANKLQIILLFKIEGMNTIITPTDFSAVSLNAVYYAADMAADLNLSLLVLHATEPDVLSFSTGEYYSNDVEEHFLKLKKDLVDRTGNKVEIRFKQVPGVIENELMKICERRHPFAVIMATRGANATMHFFMESITIHLSRHLKYPVMIVPKNIQYKQVQKIVIATDLKDVDKLPVDKIMTAVNAFKARLHVLHINTNGDEQINKHSPQVEAIKTKLQQADPAFHFLKSKNVQKGVLMFAENNNIDIIMTFPKKHIFLHRSESKQVIFNSPVTVMTIQ